MALFVATGVATPGAVHADGTTYTIGQGIEFFSGNYGTDRHTDTLYAPLSIMVSLSQRLTLTAEIPVIYQSNSTVVTGVYVGGSQNDETFSAQTSVASAGKTSEFGLGDVILKSGYFLNKDADYLQIRPTVFIKFPTADRNKSLGTGELDVGFSLEMSKWIDDWYLATEAGYVVQGRSPVYMLRNYMTYHATAGYRFGDRLMPSVVINGASPPTDGASPLLDVRTRVKYQITKNLDVEGYFAKGFTVSTPDYGMGTTLYLNF